MYLEKKIHKHFKNLIISSDYTENIEEHSLWIDTELMSPDLLEKNIKFIRNKIIDIKEDLLHNRDCANLIPKLENIEDVCREMIK